MRQLVQQFHQNGIPIQEQWLASQAQANASANYQTLFGIFLNSDMKESCVPIEADLITRLDPNHSGVIHHKNVFSAGVVLQIIDIIDVSKSLSNQMDIANGIILEEEAEKAIEDKMPEPIKGSAKGKKPPAQNNSNTSGSRTLRFVLSDGLHELVGFEYRPMPQVATETLLGCKVVVKNVEVLREHLLLTAENTRILGGSIPEMNSRTFVERLEEKFKQLKPSSANVQAQTAKKTTQKRGPDSGVSGPTKRPAPTRPNPPARKPNPPHNRSTHVQSARPQATGTAPHRQPKPISLDLDDMSELFDDSMLLELCDNLPTPALQPARPTPLKTFPTAPARTPAPKVSSQKKPAVIVLDDLSDWDDDAFMDDGIL